MFSFLSSLSVASRKLCRSFQPFLQPLLSTWHWCPSILILMCECPKSRADDDRRLLLRQLGWFNCLWGGGGFFQTATSNRVHTFCVLLLQNFSFQVLVLGHCRATTGTFFVLLKVCVSTHWDSDVLPTLGAPNNGGQVECRASEDLFWC